MFRARIRKVYVRRQSLRLTERNTAEIKQ